MLPWLVVGGSAAVMATGSVLQGLSRRRYNELDDLCIDMVCPPSSNWESIRDSGRRLARAGDVLTFTGLAGVATGVVLYFLRSSREEDTRAADETRPTANVACDGHGCLASVAGRF